MSATTLEALATELERDMLKTRLPERAMSVTTALHHAQARERPPWTGVWEQQDGRPESISLIWLHFWRGAVTPGGIAEAHESIVQRVRTGEIPALDGDDGAPTRERQRAQAQQEGPGDA